MPFLLMFNGHYPAIVPYKDGRQIEGEVWEVDDSYVSLLDGFECTHLGLYQRVMLSLTDGDEAYGYIYVSDIESFAVLDDDTWSGKYVPNEN